MKNLTKDIIIYSSPEKVFAYMDNIGNTGMHMTKSSMPMMGSKLELKQLSENEAGLNSKFRWTGKMMGFSMDFTVVVTKWIRDKEKVWETIGEAKMIILGWYQMRLVISPEGENTKAELSIAYTKPKDVFFKVIAFFLAPLYANWCLNNMLNDSKKNLETTSEKQNQ
ncbi:MAG: SRPBCC family protein [Bacteroidia bacterium]